MSKKWKKGGNCSWHDFASSILTSGIFALCIWCHSVVHQTHGGIPGEFGVESESGANGILWEFPERMELLGNLVWRTFSKNRWISAEWESKRSKIPHYCISHDFLCARLDHGLPHLAANFIKLLLSSSVWIILLLTAFLFWQHMWAIFFGSSAIKALIERWVSHGAGGAHTASDLIKIIV